MTPNIEKIFEHIEPSDHCEDLSCRQLSYHGRHRHLACEAMDPIECPRARLCADEVRDFIRRNYDMLFYIDWGN